MSYFTTSHLVENLEENSDLMSEIDIKFFCSLVPLRNISIERSERLLVIKITYWNLSWGFYVLRRYLEILRFCACFLSVGVRPCWCGEVDESTDHI